MDLLPPMDILYDSVRGIDVPMPKMLDEFYGRLAFPVQPGSPYVVGNFVSTLDGVAALATNGRPTGEVVSGNSGHDSCLMGILRAAADAIIVGAGTLAASPTHLWTPEHIYPAYAEPYKKMRDGLGKQEPVLNVIVTDRGTIDPSLPIFQSGSVQVLVVTSRTGFSRLSTMDLPAWVRVMAGDNASSLTSRQILEAVLSIRPSASIILVEGGPHLIGYFMAERALNELFLTLAPQIAGRSDEEDRMGIVAGKIFAPDHPVWASLVSVRRAESHLFLRYAFQSVENIIS
jgi:riboflavin biosynthesis pyrimidine reductase